MINIDWFLRCLLWKHPLSLAVAMEMLGQRQLDLLIAESGIALVPLTEEQAEIARRAYFTYGKSYHPAKLNLGDCCSYALATVAEQPLLFKGNDFSQTDIDYVPH